MGATVMRKFENEEMWKLGNVEIRKCENEENLSVLMYIDLRCLLLTIDY